MKPTHPNHRKMLIYAGAAGAVLALLVLLKKRQSGQAEESPAGQTYASAPSGIPAVGETTANQSSALKNELTTFEEQLRTQLLEQQHPQTQGLNIGEVAQLIGVLRSTGTGEQVGAGGQGSPSNSMPQPQEAPHPVATPPPPAPPAAPAPPAPAPPPAQPAPPPPAYHTITCGNGCPGHRYPDGRVACMVKRGGKCVWP
jgi:hypothetical protein